MSITTNMDSTAAREALSKLAQYINDDKQGPRVRILQTLVLVVRRMQIYPPPPPRSKYVRTYRFKGAWRITEQPDGWQVTNMVRDRRNRPYAGWVVGNAEGDMQAGVHQGRWPVFRTTTDAAMQRLPLAVLKDMQVITKRPGT